MSVLGTTRIEEAIGKFNGGYVWGQKILKDGTAISPADSWHDFGVIGDVTFKRKREGAEQVRDGRNYLVQDIPGALAGELTITLLQRDKKTWDIISDTFGDYYKIWLVMGQDGPGSTNVEYLDLLIPVAKFSGDQDGTVGSSRTVMTVTVSMLDTVADSTLIGGTGGLDTPAELHVNATTTTPAFTPTKTWGHADFASNQLYCIFATDRATAS